MQELGRVRNQPAMTIHLVPSTAPVVVSVLVVRLPIHQQCHSGGGGGGGGGGGKWPTGVAAADNPLPRKHLRAAPMPSSPLSAMGSRGRVTNQSKLHRTEMRLERHEPLEPEC